MATGAGNGGAVWQEADPLALALRQAGQRLQPPAADLQSARNAAWRAWQAALAERRRRHWLGSVAAALLLAFVATGWLALRSRYAPGPPSLGVWIGVAGPVSAGPSRPGQLLQSGTAIARGETIETGTGGAALLALGAAELRLGPESQLFIERAGLVRLAYGVLYVDTHDTDGAAAPLTVSTRFAEVRHLGTQFQVRVVPDGYLYAGVRAGVVAVSRDGHSEQLRRGDALRIGTDNHWMRERVPPYGPAWSWVSRHVPEFAIDGRSLAAFLDWYARETGLRLEFVAPLSRQQAEQIILRGSVANLSPEAALDAVIATTPLHVDLSAAGEIRVVE